MTNETSTTMAASRAFVPSAAIPSSWRNTMPIFSTHNAQALTSLHAVRLTDAVPAPQAGRGVYGVIKQDRPPRGEPR